jgi:hypothetical protein
MVVPWSPIKGRPRTAIISPGVPRIKNNPHPFLHRGAIKVELKAIWTLPLRSLHARQEVFIKNIHDRLADNSNSSERRRLAAARDLFYAIRPRNRLERLIGEDQERFEI